MFSKVVTGSLSGLEAEKTLVEIDLAAGLPGLITVGLPDTSVKESRERIRAAICNCGFKFPSKRITVNLSPADTRKEGTHYDLPIAVGILAASGQIKSAELDKYAFLGELSLDGRLSPVKGVLPLVIGLRRIGFQRIILPAENAEEAAAINDVQILPAFSLKQVVYHFLGGERIEAFNQKLEKEVKTTLYNEDFAEVAGQDGGKRALQIAASAQHNIAMLGPPGAGKTMMARRLPSILPQMTYEERLEVTQIYSIAGALGENGAMMKNRPFRAPHHTVSAASLVGGGRIPKPGEVSLAHHGVLFLDELPEFSRYALEMLRQPIEDEKVTLTRVLGSYTYPSKFMLVISMNPCPCGNFGNPRAECICTPGQIRAYLAKLSSPLLDRIDLQMEIFPVKYKELSASKKNKTSAQMRKEVEEARKIQLDRYKNEGIFYNSQLGAAQMEKYCRLGAGAKGLLEEAFSRLSLSARAYSRIIKLARTIADLEGRADIETSDIAEAIGYRSLDKKYKGVMG